MRNADPNRAGQYIKQIAGYQAFIPHPLPPDPPLSVDPEMMQWLSKADIALGRLDGMSEILPNPDFFVAMYVNKEGVLSSQIEGTQASLIDVLAFEAEAAEPENPQDIEEVVNYVAALRFGLQRLATLPLSLRLMREIHEKLMQGVRGSEKQPGEFRRTQNWIGGLGSTIETAQFVPPPAHEMQTALSDLERFLHAEARLPILIKIGLIHAQFETIHPFLDGNGRMGRLLITFILCAEKVLRQPLLYLSYYFKLNKADYYRLLQHVRDTGEWEPWLRFFLRGVFEVAQEATENARKILQLRERDQALIASRFARSSGTGMSLLGYLFQRPIITVKGVAEFTGQTFANANQLVLKFREAGILKEMGKQERNRRFMYFDYLKIIAGEDLPDGA
jgi:Fic family protein